MRHGWLLLGLLGTAMPIAVDAAPRVIAHRAVSADDRLKAIYPIKLRPRKPKPTDPYFDYPS